MRIRMSRLYLISVLYTVDLGLIQAIKKELNDHYPLIEGASTEAKSNGKL